MNRRQLLAGLGAAMVAPALPAAALDPAEMWERMCCAIDMGIGHSTVMLCYLLNTDGAIIVEVIDFIAITNTGDDNADRHQGPGPRRRSLPRRGVALGGAPGTSSGPGD